jgi:hypothetical protein
MKLPKRVYISVESPGTEDEFLNATTDIDMLVDETEVGIYILETVKKVKITTELV